MNEYQNNPNFLKLFSVEATFYFNGLVHRQKVRCWSDQKFYCMEMTHTHHCQQINHWQSSDWIIFFRSKFDRTFIFGVPSAAVNS